LFTWTAQADLHAFFILYIDIHATGVVTSAGEMGSISKNSFKVIVLGTGPI